ncbi:MAG: hypothetical protein R3C14_31455 [Caldilineaceae bacterium]
MQRLTTKRLILQRLTQCILLIGGLAMLGAAWGFITRAPWATSWWMLPDSPLSYSFIAAMQAAIAVAMLWIGLTGALHVIAAGSLNLIVMFTGMAVYLLRQDRVENPEMWSYGIGSVLFVLCNIGLFWWASGWPVLDQRPVPSGVRIAYWIFVAFLLGVGIALLFQTRNVLPWTLQSATSALFGWMFLGDAAYFFYGLRSPHWGNSATQLWSFLAYDAILIGPFLAHFAKVAPELRNSLIVYTAVLFFSAGVALYYLFWNPQSCIWGQSAQLPGGQNNGGGPYETAVRGG